MKKLTFTVQEDLPQLLAEKMPKLVEFLKAKEDKQQAVEKQAEEKAKKEKGETA
jgi:hypothetical protein